MPFWRLYYHLVWATDNREPVIDGEIERELFEAIRCKAKALGGQVFAVNGTEDHVHLAVTIPAKVPVADFVGEVKGSSSFHINHMPEKQWRLDWQRGYGAVTFRRDNLQQVVDYIRQQKEHHRSAMLWRTLEDSGEDDTDQVGQGQARESREAYDVWG